MPINTYIDNFYDKHNSETNVWDSVVSCFKCINIDKSSYTPGIDNYETVWPVLSQVICSQLTRVEGVRYRACDFGCGIGKFAEQLYQMKFQTFACDTSSKMIEQARLLTQNNIVYGVGSTNFIQKYSPFKLITAIMVFQFIDDFDSVCNTLSKSITEDGILFFAIHDIQYIKECIECGVKFRGIENETFPTTAEILIGTSWIKTYVRSSEWYDNIMSSKGLIRIGHALKGETPPLGISEKSRSKWQSSKYYIAWYKKKASVNY